MIEQRWSNVCWGTFYTATNLRYEILVDSLQFGFLSAVFRHYRFLVELVGQIAVLIEEQGATQTPKKSTVNGDGCKNKLKVDYKKPNNVVLKALRLFVNRVSLVSHMPDAVVIFTSFG